MKLPFDVMTSIVEFLDTYNVGNFMVTCTEARNLGITVYEGIIGDDIYDHKLRRFSVNKYVQLQRIVPDNIMLFIIGLSTCIICEENSLGLLFDAACMRDSAPDLRTMICENCIEKSTCGDCTYVHADKNNSMEIVPACNDILKCCWKYRCSDECRWVCFKCRKQMHPEEAISVIDSGYPPRRTEKLILCIDCKEIYYENFIPMDCINWYEQHSNQ